MRAYEGLFLVDEGKASDDFQAIAGHIRGLLERRGASVDKLEKWDALRLAYEIERKKRGMYILAKFNADPAQVAEIRNDCLLSALVLRTMLLREEHVGSSLEAAEQAQRTARRAHDDERPATEAKPEKEPEAPDEAKPGGEPSADILGDVEALEEPPAEDKEPN